MADEQKEPRTEETERKTDGSPETEASAQTGESNAYEKKAADKTGRDWTKRRTFLKPGQV
jgi:hypothetical protein